MVINKKKSLPARSSDFTTFSGVDTANDIKVKIREQIPFINERDIITNVVRRLESIIQLHVWKWKGVTLRI